MLAIADWLPILDRVNVLLVPIGSHGDVHPFIGLGQALRARGHRVKVLVNPHFIPLVEKTGLETAPVGAAEQYESAISNPELWNKVKGTMLVFRHLTELIEPAYQAVMASHVPGDTLIVAATLALGARTAAEKHGIPCATIHLQPTCFRSMTDPPVMQGLLLGPRVPKWVMRIQYAIADRLMIDRAICPTFNAFRAKLGLPSVSHILRDQIHSPSLTIGMWPEWFAPKQADWPASARLADFPLYDERDVTPISPELNDFLAAGPPPTAFTFGSAMRHGHELLAASTQACIESGRRGILLTRHREHVPANLPNHVLHVDYAPLSQLLPRCATLVHHGGIGTASQALAAGVPQLIVPHAHDQFDNAARIARLGVGSSLMPNRYTPGRINPALDSLGTGATIQKCKAVAGKLVGRDGLAVACNLIEAAFVPQSR